MSRGFENLGGNDEGCFPRAVRKPKEEAATEVWRSSSLGE